MFFTKKWESDGSGRPGKEKVVAWLKEREREEAAQAARERGERKAYYEGLAFAYRDARIMIETGGG